MFVLVLCVFVCAHGVPVVLCGCVCVCVFCEGKGGVSGCLSMRGFVEEGFGFLRCSVCRAGVVCVVCVCLSCVCVVCVWLLFLVCPRVAVPVCRCSVVCLCAILLHCFHFSCRTASMVLSLVGADVVFRVASPWTLWRVCSLPSKIFSVVVCVCC